MSRIIEEMFAILVWILMFTLIVGFLVKNSEMIEYISLKYPPTLVQKVFYHILLEIPEGGGLVLKTPELGGDYSFPLNLTKVPQLANFSSIIILGGREYVIEKINGEIRVYPYGG